MATNLRLPAATELALRQRADRTGRSQQDLIRTALDEYLGLVAPAAQTLDELVASGVASEPRPLIAVAPISLPADLSSLDLLQREDRI